MPVIVAETVAGTGVVAIAKVPVDDPAVTVTVEGKVALVELDVRLTTEPPGPAAPLSVTVPVEPIPPATEVGETVTLSKVAGVIVSGADCVPPLRVPVIVAVVEVETALVETVKVADVVPAATVTFACNVAEALLELRVTTAPEGPAGPLSVTVPVEVLPPTTDVGFSDRPDRVAALIVSVAVFDVPADVAVIVAEVFEFTAMVVTVNGTVEAPAGTVTDASTVAFVLLEESVTTVPPGPAFPLSVTVPVDEVPPVTVVGLSDSPDSVAGVIVKVPRADWPL